MLQEYPDYKYRPKKRQRSGDEKEKERREKVIIFFLFFKQFLYVLEKENDHFVSAVTKYRFWVQMRSLHLNLKLVDYKLILSLSQGERRILEVERKRLKVKEEYSLPSPASSFGPASPPCLLPSPPTAHYKEETWLEQLGGTPPGKVPASPAFPFSPNNVSTFSINIAMTIFLKCIFL